MTVSYQDYHSRNANIKHNSPTLIEVKHREVKSSKQDPDTRKSFPRNCWEFMTMREYAHWLYMDECTPTFTEAVKSFSKLLILYYPKNGSRATSPFMSIGQVFDMWLLQRTKDNPTPTFPPRIKKEAVWMI